MGRAYHALTVRFVQQTSEKSQSACAWKSANIAIRTAFLLAALGSSSAAAEAVKKCDPASDIVGFAVANAVAEAHKNTALPHVSPNELRREASLDKIARDLLLCALKREELLPADKSDACSPHREGIPRPVCQETGCILRRAVRSATERLRESSLIDPYPQLVIAKRKKDHCLTPGELVPTLLNHLAFIEKQVTRLSFGHAESAVKDGEYILLFVTPKYVEICEGQEGDQHKLLISGTSREQPGEGLDRLELLYSGFTKSAALAADRKENQLCRLRPGRVQKQVVPRDNPITLFPRCDPAQRPLIGALSLDQSVLKALCLQWSGAEKQKPQSSKATPTIGPAEKTAEPVRVAFPHLVQVVRPPLDGSGQMAHGRVLANIPIRCSGDPRQGQLTEKAYSARKRDCPRLAEPEAHKDLPLCGANGEAPRGIALPPEFANALLCWLNAERHAFGASCLLPAAESPVLRSESPIVGGHPRRRFQNPATLSVSNAVEAPSLWLAHRELMASPSHRANLLNPQLSHVFLQACRVEVKASQEGPLNYAAVRLHQFFFNVSKPDTMEPLVPIRDCALSPEGSP